jgi:hypothetical protein
VAAIHLLAARDAAQAHAATIESLPASEKLPASLLPVPLFHEWKRLSASERTEFVDAFLAELLGLEGPAYLKHENVRRYLQAVRIYAAGLTHGVIFYLLQSEQWMKGVREARKDLKAGEVLELRRKSCHPRLFLGR